MRTSAITARASSPRPVHSLDVSDRIDLFLTRNLKFARVAYQGEISRTDSRARRLRIRSVRSFSHMQPAAANVPLLIVFHRMSADFLELITSGRGDGHPFSLR